jgi:O-antigen ligase
MVTHNAYLQVWADAGFIGMACFLTTVWSWLPLWRTLRLTRPTLDIHQQAHLFNSLFLLAVFGLSLAIHPVSTEWSEWITFAIPYAILARIVAPHRAKPIWRLSHVCQPSLAG